MTLNKKIKQFIANTGHYVILPDMNQKNGVWNEIKKERCCFGARIARALCEHRLQRLNNYRTFKFWYFQDGLKEMLNRLDVTEKELYTILYVCGTGTILPFSGREWKNNPKHVYQKLIKIERKPTCEEINFIINCHADEFDSHSDSIRNIYQLLCKPK